MPTSYVENADLAKDDTLSKGSKYSFAIVTYHAEPAFFNNVHLLADVTLGSDRSSCTFAARLAASTRASP